MDHEDKEMVGLREDEDREGTGGESELQEQSWGDWVGEGKKGCPGWHPTGPLVGFPVSCN